MSKKKHLFLCVRRALSVCLSVLCVLAVTVCPGAAEEDDDFVYVSDLPCVYWEMYMSASDNPASPYSPSFDSNEQGGPLVIADEVFAKGLRTHPNGDGPAVFRYDISGLPYRTFSATVGKDSLGGPGLIRFSVSVDGEEVCSSAELPFGESETITCSVEGGSVLELYVWNVDGCTFDSAGWGNAVLTMGTDVPDIPDVPVDERGKYDPARDDFKGEEPAPQTGDVIWVSDLRWLNWRMIASNSGQESPQYTPSFNCNEAGGIITINGIEYEKGIRIHPDMATPADVVYDISAYSEQYPYFTATVGRDSASAGGGFVRFQVLVDGVVVAETADLTLEEDAFICADVKGGHYLTLRVDPTSDGYHHDSSAWGAAQLCDMTVASIEIIDTPFKTKYTVGDTFNPAGCRIKVTYTNGTSFEEDVEAGQMSAVDLSAAGTQTVTVAAYGKTATFDVTVSEPATEPATEPVTEPATEPVTEPVTEPATEPVTDPAVETDAAPDTEPTQTMPADTGADGTDAGTAADESGTAASGSEGGCKSAACGLCLILLLPAVLPVVRRRRRGL